MNTIITLPDRSMSCSCGAKCAPAERGRFRKRHPEKCSAHSAQVAEKRAFAKKLASGTRSVEEYELTGTVPSDREERNELIAHQLAEIMGEGKGLTKWESEFIESTGKQWGLTGDLSDKQVGVLGRIYADRV